jgi:hypothetical protein
MTASCSALGPSECDGLGGRLLLAPFLIVASPSVRTKPYRPLGGLKGNDLRDMHQ